VPLQLQSISNDIEVVLLNMNEEIFFLSHSQVKPEVRLRPV
jgi:hypothetical protein